MADSPSKPIPHVPLALGLTSLVIGLSFALPMQLVPEQASGVMTGKLSREVSNVYACTAWGGWAHFLYAYRGQGRALRGHGRLLPSFVLVLLAAAAVLIGARSLVGVGVFGGLVWVYFLDHFLKAERLFDGKKPHRTALERWGESAQVLASFGWLSAVLIIRDDITSRPWLLWSVSLLLAAAIIGLGGWKSLLSEESRGSLLSLIFVGESLVWGTLARFTDPVFISGVYLFHIAAGSWLHYFGSYQFGSMRRSAREWVLGPVGIVAINAAVMGLGYAVNRYESLGWLVPVLGVQWFTVWVGLHLVASDLYPAFRSRAKA